MTLQQNHHSQQTTEKARTKRSVENGINETDFINPMFLRSTFLKIEVISIILLILL